MSVIIVLGTVSLAFSGDHYLLPLNKSTTAHAHGSKQMR